MSNTKSYIQEFTVKEDGIHIIATSGNAYLITRTSCSCKGFGFRKTCGHFQEATEKDLLSLIPVKTIQQIAHHKPSGKLVDERKKAIRKYLTLHSIPSSDDIVNALEKIVTQTMKPSEFLEIAKKEVSSLASK